MSRAHEIPSSQEIKSSGCDAPVLWRVNATFTDPATALTHRGFSVVTMLGVFAIVQALVRHGKVTGRAFVHTTAAAITLALIDLHAGTVLGGLMISGAVTRRFKGRRRSVSCWSGICEIHRLSGRFG